MPSVGRKAGPHAPVILDASELPRVVERIQDNGAFTFDVETRGVIHRNAEVMALVEQEWEQKLSELKTTNEKQLARSRQAIEDRWTKEVALDPLRNEVFWISLATKGMSWVIPMGHDNGEVLIPEQIGDGKTTPPSGYYDKHGEWVQIRDILSSGKESMKKAKYFIPAVFTDPPEQLDRDTVFEALQPIFFDDTIRKINQNIKFDAKSIAKYYGGNLPTGEYIDTQVLMHIYDENQKDKGGFSLTEIIKRVLKDDPYSREGKIGGTIVHEPFGKAARYSHYDARYPWLLYNELWKAISRYPGLYNALLHDIPVMRVTAQMEMYGVEIDQRMLKKLGKEFDLDINQALMEIGQHVWPGFNPDSDNDVKTLLFNKKRKPKDAPENYQTGLGLKPTKWTDTTKNLPLEQRNPSVDADTLRSFSGEAEVIDHLLNYNKLVKIKGTYIDGTWARLHNGRLHPSFNLHRTDTGRLSADNPNLQNIPRDDRLRSLFVAERGHSLIVADYDQIELRIMAMYSQDPVLLHVFQNDIDIHYTTASLILGKPIEDISKEERTVYGKAPNFLMGYGGGPKRLVEATEKVITLDRAKEVIDQYNSGYQGLTDWKAKALKEAKKKGYVETLGGRRRRLPNLNHERNTREGWGKATKAERQAINAIIQGTAAEICKDAMVALDKNLGPECKFILQVHDELVTSVPTESINTWEPVIEKSMGNGTILMGVPLNVTAHHAGSWDQAKG